MGNIDKANTPDEIVDVIDEQDSVIGKSTKAVVNSDPSLIHREIAIIIFDDQNRVLVQQRSKNKKSHPLMWTLSVAGHVPSGMGYEEAAHMELNEELGFDTKLEPYEKMTFREPRETQTVTSFLGRFPSNASIIINKDEIESCRFVTESELENLNRNESVEEGSFSDMKKFFNGNFQDIIEKLKQ